MCPRGEISAIYTTVATDAMILLVVENVRYSLSAGRTWLNVWER